MNNFINCFLIYLKLKYNKKNTLIVVLIVNIRVLLILFSLFQHFILNSQEISLKPIHTDQFYINFPNQCILIAPKNKNYFIKAFDSGLVDINYLGNQTYVILPYFNTFQYVKIQLYKKSKRRSKLVKTMNIKISKLPKFEYYTKQFKDSTNISKLPNKIELNITYKIKYLDSIIKPRITSFKIMIITNNDSIIELKSENGYYIFSNYYEINTLKPKLIVIDSIRAKIYQYTYPLSPLQYTIKQD